MATKQYGFSCPYDEIDFVRILEDNKKYPFIAVEWETRSGDQRRLVLVQKLIKEELDDYAVPDLVITYKHVYLDIRGRITSDFCYPERYVPVYTGTLTPEELIEILRQERSKRAHCRVVAYSI